MGKVSKANAKRMRISVISLHRLSIVTFQLTPIRDEKISLILPCGLLLLEHSLTEYLHIKMHIKYANSTVLRMK